MSMHPTQAREVRPAVLVHLAQAFRSFASRWTGRGELRKLAAQSPERLLRDIGLTAADIEVALDADDVSALTDIANARSRNW